MASRKKLVLYFTPEAGITEEQAAEMERIPGARQRNASLIDPEGPLERCDAVAGPAIPEQYAEAYPEAVPLKAAEEQEEEEEEADSAEDMSVSKLKAALKDKGVDIPSGAKKAELVLLYNEHIGS